MSSTPRPRRPADPSLPPVSRRLPPPRRSLAMVAVGLLLFAGGLALTGCGVSEPPVGSIAAEPDALTLPYPESRQLEIAWGMDEAIETRGDRPTVFIHLLPEEDREVLRTYDHPLPENWRPGGEVSYPLAIHQSLLGPPLPAGTYRLTAGLYDGDQRWALQGEETERTEYLLATVEVPAPRLEDLPTLDYEGNWSPLRTGHDRQVLGWRFLGQDAILRVADVPGPGTLGLGFEIAPAPEGVTRFPVVLDAAPTAAGDEEGDGSAAEDDGTGEDGGETEAVAEDGSATEDAVDSTAPSQGAPSGPDGTESLRVTFSCNDSQQVLSGVGQLSLEVPMQAGEDCAVRLRPNFGQRLAPGAQGVTEMNQADELVRLVRVTWTPRGGGSGG